MFCFSNYSSYLCTRSIKSRHSQEWTRQPSNNIEPRWSVRCGSIIIHFKNKNVMQQSIYYIKFALQFADLQITELVDIFNRQVGNRGWTGMRAYHNQALIDEFHRRGIDVSAIYDRATIGFAHHIRYSKTSLFYRLKPIYRCSALVSAFARASPLIEALFITPLISNKTRLSYLYTNHLISSNPPKRLITSFEVQYLT